MAINPFEKIRKTRSQYIPSGNFMPFKISNGIAIPNEIVNADYALTNSDIFSIVHRVSADVAACDLRTVNIQLKNLYKRPSKLINGYGFWETVVANLLLNGNAFVVIKRDDKGNPVSLENIPLSQIQIELLDCSIDLLYEVNYQDERGIVKVNSSNMLHFRIMPFNSQGALQYSGISPLTSLATELNTQELSNKLTLSTLKHAILPNVVLKSPAGLLSPEAKEKIRNEYETKLGGDNAGRVAVMDQSLDIQTIQINADVAKFLSNVSISQTQIAKAFSIDASYLDSSKGSQQSNIEQIRSLYADSLQSYMKPIESELEAKFDCDCNLDVTSAIDIDNQQFVDNISKLTTGTTPVVPPEKALIALQNKGVI
ncbi:phage portal protein [Liquorilactobacillus satsumensis]|uniref:Phage portal protein, HK97 family n=1 Tax=Liquorilactobacillus satsumensis DSM 16230 = JCM 12392 TaxID=1423801 RepID=A0A0R1V8V1_9LACO|nr:phage portal protein [Liquorilactobacillus satsumensis]KRL99752.1 phage portal protein, HK97 family [Liquorilactobacillus satsumensis DSM 16230 = JCM 12392]